MARRQNRNSPLFRRFNAVIRQRVNTQSARQLVEEARKYARGGRNLIPSSVRTAMRSMFDRIIRGMGWLGDLVKSFLRPGGRRVADEAKELAAAMDLLDTFGGRQAAAARPPAATPGARVPAMPNPETILEAAGFSTTAPIGRAAPGIREAESFPVDPDGFPEWKPTDGRRPASSTHIDVKVGGEYRRYKQNDPVVTGAMIAVSSSNVHSIGFVLDWDNPAKSTLKVQFLQSKAGTKAKGAGPLYYYYGVHPDLFTRFRIAASKGKFVWDRLRVRGTVSGHQYQYELKGITDGYVPRKAQRFGPNEYFLRRSMKMRNPRTGEVRQMESSLADQRVRGTPQRGAPNRGTPNRGR